MLLELSERQRTTTAAAITILSACVIVVAIGALFWLIGSFFARFSDVFLPLAVAAVAALVFRPYYDWLRTKLKLGRILALLAVLLSMVIPLGAFLWFFGALLVGQVSDLVQQVPALAEKLWTAVKDRAPEVVAYLKDKGLYDRLTGAFESHQGMLVQGIQAIGNQALSAGAGVLGLIGKLLAWVVLPVYFAFFLISEQTKVGEIERFLPFLKPETRRDVAYLVTQFVDILVAFFRGQLVIAFLQGLLFGIGFTLVGLSYGFVLGLVFGFLNIIPYLGSTLTLVTTIPIAFFQAGGGLTRALLVLMVFVTVQMIEGYVLTPRIMGDRTGLHPMAIIVAIFFWGSALGGLTGMILAIPLTAFLVVFFRLARDRWVRELV